ncbi:glutathione binding-like protein [Thalassospira alkalitolerans]|uniref:glutathione binding-like protein n=1 Tax=Thalassospira alkalitolerans TaxID=1293890 RepID=UPI003AA98186
MRHWNLTGKNERNEGQLAKRRSGALGVLAILDRHLQDHDFLSNSRYSLADIAVYAYTHLAGESGLDMAPFVALNHWINRIGDLVGDAIPVRYYSEDSFSGRDL